ncbi:hypothetical protein KIPB_011008, partial [Kipferlia bialata]
HITGLDNIATYVRGARIKLTSWAQATQKWDDKVRARGGAVYQSACLNTLTTLDQLIHKKPTLHISADHAAHSRLHLLVPSVMREDETLINDLPAILNVAESKEAERDKAAIKNGGISMLQARRGSANDLVDGHNSLLAALREGLPHVRASVAQEAPPTHPDLEKLARLLYSVPASRPSGTLRHKTKTRARHAPKV